MNQRAILSYTGTDSVPTVLGEGAVRSIVDWVPSMFRIGTWEYCFYCGEPPSCQDHVIPWVFLSVVGDHSGESGGIKTPACASCNSLLSDTFYPTLWGRCRGLQERLVKKYKKVTRSPKWHPLEIAQLGKNLRNSVARKQKERATAMRRITWQASGQFQKLMEEAKAKAVWEFPNNRELHKFLAAPWITEA